MGSKVTSLSGSKRECPHREKKTRALRHEQHAESSRETGECTEHHVHTPRLQLHVSDLTMDGVAIGTNYNPGQEGSKDGADDPKSSDDDDKWSATAPGEELTEIGKDDGE